MGNNKINNKKIKQNQRLCKHHRPSINYIKPPPVTEGDQIGIIIPASPIKEPFRTKGLKQIKALGYVPVEVNNVLNSRFKGDFLAKSTKDNISDIIHFFQSKDIKAIWAGRGGYGSNHLLDHLHLLEQLTPKMIIGSSDISYLLWYLLDQFQLIVIYGPMVYSSVAEGNYNATQLKKILKGNFNQLQIPGKVLKAGYAKGIITGGCLSNFISLIGTAYLPIVENRILLLEDIGERPFRLDRMFWQIHQSGILNKINGLVLGEFPNCFNDQAEKQLFLHQILEYLKSYQFPVIYDLPLGHSNNIQTIPLGIEMEIDTIAKEGLLRSSSFSP